MPLLGRQKGYLKAAKHLEARERWDRPNSQSGLASNHLAAAIHNIRFSYRTSFRLAYCEGRGKERGKKKKERKERKKEKDLYCCYFSTPAHQLLWEFPGKVYFFYFFIPIFITSLYLPIPFGSHFIHLVLPFSLLSFSYSFCFYFFPIFSIFFRERRILALLYIQYLYICFLSFENRALEGTPLHSLSSLARRHSKGDTRIEIHNS